MKKCILVAAALAVGSLFAQDGTWKYRAGIGTTPLNAVDWADPENWVDGLVATGVSSVATFAADSNKAIVWIRIPDRFCIGKVVTANNTPKARLMCDGTLFIDRGSKTDAGFSSGGQNYCFVWADLISTSGMFNHYCWHLCAPTRSTGDTLRGSGGHIRADYFATSSSEIISDLFSVSPDSAQVFNSGSRDQVSLYSRKAVAASVGTWDTVAGKKIIKYRTGGKGTTLSPGQTIQAPDVFPEGTYIKRIYSDDYIELSAAALETRETGAELAFAAFSPRIEQTISSFKADADDVGLITLRQTVNDVIDLTIEKFVASNNRPTFYTTLYGSYPGRNILKDTSGARRGVISRCSSHIVLTATNETGLCGLNALYLHGKTKASYNYYGTTTVEIGAGADATIHELTKVPMDSPIAEQTTFRKIGEGRLTVKPTQEQLDAFNVKAGTLVCMPTNTNMTLASLTVSSGATFTLAAGKSMEVSTLTLEENATLKVEEGATLTFQKKSLTMGCRILGPGTVVGSLAGSADAIVFGDGVKLSDTAAASTEYTVAYPTDVSKPCVDPVFWVDAQDTDSIVYAAGSSTNIKRVNDCRGTDAKYNFATNVASVYPTKSDSSFIMMAKKGTKVVATTQALVWGRPIFGIRAYFIVTMSNGSLQNTLGAGALIGSTERIRKGTYPDFYKEGLSAESALLSSGAADCVKNGRFYINGAARAYTQGRLGHFSQIIEIHPNAPGGDADAFGFQYGSTYDGALYLGEALVYTNELTYAQRTQIAGYLANKWYGGKVSYVDFPADGSFGSVRLDGSASFGAESGMMAEIKDVQGTGTLATKGAGTFHLRRFVNPQAGLHVTAGITKLESFDPQAESMVPANPEIRVDASKLSSITTNGVGDVTAWSNLGDTEKYDFGTVGGKKAKLIVDEALPSGRPVVDLGELMINTELGLVGSADIPWENRLYCSIFKAGTTTASSFNARSVFGMLGTKYGGNELLAGNTGDRSTDAGLVRRPPTHDATQPIVRDNVSMGADFTARAVSPVITNGVKNVKIMSTGYSGGYETVGWWSMYSQKATGIGHSRRMDSTGGFQIGEYLIYSRTLEESEVYKLDAYLGAKWLGRVSPRYALAKMGPLTVDSGATLDIVGGAPVMATTLSGAGTINGAVTLAENAVFAVPVDADGTITQTLTVSGAVDLSKGGTVQLTGDSVGNLKAGKYRLIASTQLGAVGSWTVTGYAGRKILKLKTDASGLWLEVANCGLVLFVQ